jgi:hypothetical protein
MASLGISNDNEPFSFWRRENKLGEIGLSHQIAITFTGSFPPFIDRPNN